VARKYEEELLGLYDDGGVRLGVSGEPFYRVHITPQGEVKTGLGVSAPTPLSSGPSGPVPGQIIGSTRWAPAAQVITNTASATPVIISATNLSLSFVVPPSGKVVVALDAFLVGSSGYPHWGLMENGVFVPGSAKRTSHTTVQAGASYLKEFVGLTPGENKTWAWAHWTMSGTSLNFYADDGGLAAGGLGSPYMEARAA